jgi:hypothetical protein
MSEIKRADIKPCAKCGKGVMHTGLPLFWRVTIERYGIDANAVRRQVGLEMMLGSPALAAVMGPDETMAKPVMDDVILILCENCAMEDYPVAALAELVKS